jgi:hypothetical protein
MSPSDAAAWPRIDHDPNYVRVWRVTYQFKTELAGWQPGTPFLMTAAAGRTMSTPTALALAAAAHHDAIGVEITGAELSSPLTSEES